MDKGIERILGILGDEKRVYRFSEDVNREEFQYTKILDTMVFGEKGLVPTLGQTWSLVNDPRFQIIESKFIVSRRALFGGDASTGKQYMSSDGLFTSLTADLEEYAQVLGEGRHFCNVLTHPDEDCPTRKWLERIHTGTNCKAGELTCKCDTSGGILLKCVESKQTPPDLGEDTTTHYGICLLPTLYKTFATPNTLKDETDENLWLLIKRECPNYFSQTGKPNQLATRLFDMFRADLVGLIYDYSITPLIDEWVLLETGDVVEPDQDSDHQQPSVFAEVDILEKALTYRATMRATAAKILRSIGFHHTLKNMDGSYCYLTDKEKDTLLRLVYQSNWPDDKAALISSLTLYIAQVNKIPFEERQREQLAQSSQRSKETVSGLLDGTILPINQYTEPMVEVEQDEFAQTLQAMLADPRKQELFMILAEAERRADDENTPDEEKLNMRQLKSMLFPVFMNADYKLEDAEFEFLIDNADNLGFWDTKTTQVEEEFNG